MDPTDRVITNNYCIWHTNTLNWLLINISKLIRITCMYVKIPLK